MGSPCAAYRVVSLDWDEFLLLTAGLSRQGWKQHRHREHRWTTPAGNVFGLLPAGPRLRAEGRIVWPVSGFVMGLDGFDHIFADYQEAADASGLSLGLISPRVLALLKILAYLDDPHRRLKDLDDFRAILSRYEATTDRMFSDEVLDENLSDFGLGSAFLLGRDLRRLCLPAEIGLIRRFISMIEESGTGHTSFVAPRGFWSESAEAEANQLLEAFKRGLGLKDGIADQEAMPPWSPPGRRPAYPPASEPARTAAAPA